MIRTDVAIVGGGAAGIAAALAARHEGADVVLVEEAPRLGGDCTFFGCVPSKTLIEIASAVRRARELASAGVLGPHGPPDFAAALRHVHETVAAIADDERDERFTALGIRVLHAQARFLSPSRLRSGDGTEIEFGRAVVATGTRPTVPALAGIERVGYVTNETVFDLQRLPRRLVVLGGGPTGLELAQAFSRLGSETTVVEAAERVLAAEELETSAAITAVLGREGIAIVTRTEATRVARDRGAIELSLADGSQVAGDALLVTTGRRAGTETLGLEQLGVRLRGGYIEVDERCRTSIDTVFAAGDVTGEPQFTHVAAHEGRVAGTNAAGGRARRDLRVVPSVVYTDPEIARVGLGERHARERHRDVRVLSFPMSRVDRARIEGRTDGFVKLILAPRPLLGRLGGGRLLGAHVVGPRAAEIVHECALVMKTRAFPGRLAETIHAYPSLAMGVQQAAAQLYPLGRLLAPPERPS